VSVTVSHVLFPLELRIHLVFECVCVVSGLRVYAAQNLWCAQNPAIARI
jgi:hypothetical protein